MERKYFIITNNKKLGGFSFDELRQKDIYSDTLIWYEGLEDWVLANELDEFKNVIKQIPKMPKTPQEQLSGVLKTAIQKESKFLILYSILSSIIISFTLGSLLSNETLNEVYHNNGINVIWAYPTEIRNIIIPLISLVFVSLPAALLYLFFVIQKEKGEIKKNSISINNAFKKAFSLALVIIIVFFTLSICSFQNSKNYDSLLDQKDTFLIKTFPFGFYLLSILTILIFYLLKNEKQND